MPHGPLGERIPFEGVLNCWNDDHDLPDLLLAISRSGKTGRLHFSNPEGDKTLDLRAGKIVFAESSSQDDGLGQYLLRTGEISLMDYIRVSKLVQPGKRLGELLVEQKVLEEDDLVPAVIGQVRSVILSLFRRTETWYRFKEEELERKESITLDLAVPELILEGVRYVESWRRVSKGAGSLESVYQTVEDCAEEWQDSHLDDEVLELVDMLAVPTSLQDICTKATLPDFEACRYLWAFRALGWINLVDQAKTTLTATDTAAAAEEQPAAPTPAPTPADTPTLPSIERPPAAIPQELVQTQLAVKAPDAPRPQTPEQAAPPTSTPIPERLIQTQVSASAASHPSPPSSIPESLQQTQRAVEAPPAAPPQKPAAIPDELAHTQMFIEPPPREAPAPASTGEFMESILEGDDATTTPPAPTPSPSPPPTPAPSNQAATQFFDGPSALGPIDTDLATTTPSAAAPPKAPEPAQAPSGFEALALGGGPGGPPSGPVPPAAAVTQPSVQPPSEGGMASFSDLALPDVPPAEPSVPMVEVEAEVISAEPTPPLTPAFTPDEPLLPPSISTGPIQRESLVPPRRRAEVDLDDKK